MYQRHRFLVAVLAALSFLALGAFAASRSKPPQANVHKAKKIKPYKAQKINKKKQYDKTVQEAPLKLGHRSCHPTPTTDKVVTQSIRPSHFHQRPCTAADVKQISYPCHMLIWETVDSQAPAHRGSTVVMRAKVPGGWLVNVIIAQVGMGMTFYPDPDYAWDGSSNQSDSH